MKLSKAEKKRLRKERHLEKIQEKKTVQKESREPDIRSWDTLVQYIKANRQFLLLLTVLTFTAYFYILFADFVTADDYAGIVINDRIKDFRLMLSTLNIVSISRSAIIFVSGLNPFVHHLNSLLMHITVIYLFFIFSSLIFRKEVTIISSVLFAVHPVNTEAVSWISGSGYLYNAAFTFSVLIAYVLFRKSGRYSLLAASIAMFILGMILTGSAWMLTVPFIVAGVEFFLLEDKFKKSSAAYVAPFIIIGTMSALLFFVGATESRVYHLQTDYGMDPSQSTPLLNRLPYSLYMTVTLLTFPFRLALFHEGNVISKPFYTLMIITTVLYVTAVIYLLKKGQRKKAGLLTLIICAVLPIFSPVQIAFFIAERYMYIATAFFALLVAKLMYAAEKRYHWPRFAFTATIVIASFYMIRTAVRTYDWQNSKNLWYSNSKVSPNSPRIYNNLGDAYAREKDYLRSIEAFERAIELDPNYIDAIHNLGVTYVDAAMYDKAELQFKKALEMDPQYEGAGTANSFLSAWQQRKQ